MTRDEFYTERLARYLGEGMAMEAAKARASGVTCTFYPSLAIDGPLSQAAMQKDYDEDQESAGGPGA
jgi:hypothetical protein